MDLKEYRTNPDEGLFENIERRLLRRRWLRRGAALLTAAVVVAGALWLWPSAPSSDMSATQPVTTAAVTEPAYTENTGILPQQEQPAPTTQSVTLTSHVSPLTSDVSPLTSDLSPLTSHLTTPTSDLSPLTSHVSPLTSDLSPLPSEPSMPMEEPVAENPIVAEEVPSDHPLTAPANNNQEPSGSTHYENLLYAPNVIVPSGDDDRNRLFKLTTSSEVSDFHMYIFNRGGRQVFSSTDINRSWDATHDGTPLPQGAYVWVARFRDSSGNLHEEKGTVTVLR